LAFDRRDIHTAYANGRGGVITRGEAEIIEESSGNSQIIINSIPYRVNKSDLISKIAELHSSKKIEVVSPSYAPISSTSPSHIGNIAEAIFR